MAFATDRPTFRVPLFRSPKAGIRDINGLPINLAVESPVRFVVGVFDSADVFEAAPAETNIVIKFHHLEQDGSLGTEIGNQSVAITASTLADWRRGDGHASVDFTGTEWKASGTAPTYDGGGTIRMSIYLDAVKIIDDDIVLFETGSSILKGALLARAP